MLSRELAGVNKIFDRGRLRIFLQVKGLALLTNQMALYSWEQSIEKEVLTKSVLIAYIVLLLSLLFRIIENHVTSREAVNRISPSG